MGMRIRGEQKSNRLAMSLRPPDPPKLFLLFISALWVCNFTRGLSITYFGEDKCTTPLPSPFQGAPNPLVAPLNQCTKSFEDGPTTFYIRPTICSSTYPYPIYTYEDANCSVTHLEPHSFIIGACVTQGTPAGCGSFMITCSPAAAGGPYVALVALAAIFIFL